MTRLLITTAALLACSASPAAAHHIRYQADYTATGTWSESVRADEDPGDRDGDGREEAASRDQVIRFTLTASIPSVTFNRGTPRTTSSVTHHLSQEIVSSTVTEPNGESGACTTLDPGAGGSAELFAAGDLGVFRPASDVIIQASCRTPMLEWPFHMNAQRQSALDAAFTLPKLGAKRIEIPVARKPAAPCPVEDPGHTVACSFDWTGKVVLTRLSDAVRIGRPRVRGKRVTVVITTPTGTRTRTYRKTRRLTVRHGDLTRTFTIR